LGMFAAMSFAEHTDIPADNGGCSSGGGSGEDAGFLGTAGASPLEQEVYTAATVIGGMPGERSQNVSAQARLIDMPGTSSKNDYRLLSIAEVEAHIKAEKHLPGIPSARCRPGFCRRSRS
jgi:hypothetical protein